MRKPLVSRKGSPGGPTRNSWIAPGRHDPAHAAPRSRGPRGRRRRCSRGSPPRSWRRTRPRRGRRREHQQEDGDPLHRVGRPGADAAGQRAPRRDLPPRDHLVVQPVGGGEPLPGHHEAERLRVARRERAPDPLHPLPRLPGDPRGQPGLQRVVPGEQHEPERAPGEPSRPGAAARARPAPPRWPRRSAGGTRRRGPRGSARGAGAARSAAPPRWGPRRSPARRPAARGRCGTRARPPRRPC